MANSVVPWRSALLLGLMGTVAAAGWWLPESDPQPESANAPDHADRTPVLRAERKSRRPDRTTAPRVRDRLVAAERSDPRAAVTIEHAPDGDDGDEHRAWADASPRTRVRTLTRDFEGAVARVEGDPSDERSRRVAEDALTALRAELYATPRGKERHLAMERKLVAALPSQAGSDGRDEASAENSELGGQP